VLFPVVHVPADTKEGGGDGVNAAARAFRSGVEGMEDTDGKRPLASSRQERMERFVLAFSRKMRPRRMLRQPREKRKKAETRVKVLVCCERTVAPILIEVSYGTAERERRTGIERYRVPRDQRKNQGRESSDRRRWPASRSRRK
jgi:hypothetical protein